LARKEVPSWKWLLLKALAGLGPTSKSRVIKRNGCHDNGGWIMEGLTGSYIFLSDNFLRIYCTMGSDACGQTGIHTPLDTVLLSIAGKFLTST